ncbi:MAG: Mur ligase family protein [Euryarchaeota archaeon]|uniref:Mur ligase family protein n=1 Tax=Methanobacterium sp. MZD130B TaxID=3394378 RepID=UPI001771EF44|nr:Mur ligase family protein [Euryarchaeota archaeon]HHT19543.1 UDP-N-acetylmuramoyl-L-alanine--D-glutamate ligase [Methanobacterium sp.]
MKVAVVGLGVEGINAVESLLNHGYKVYASDIDPNIKLKENKNLEIDLGFHDFKKIQIADAIVLSPSLWNTKVFQKFKSDKKLLSDMITDHRSIFTIGVTGTNGKTTTTMMINDILKKSGLNVLTGGNAGGGFTGYTEIILESKSASYDVILVEVCDMTLDFCQNTFDFDLIVLTNIGRDHLEFHKSFENYTESLKNFVKGKTVVLNRKNEVFGHSIEKIADVNYFDKISYEINLFGKYNLENAAASAKAAEILEIPEKIIETSLKEFDVLPGRSASLKLPTSRIVVGKTDNVDATSAVLDEVEFPVIILGTPRKGELCRFDIFREVSKTNSKIIAIFPGLDDTLEVARNILEEENYNGEIFNLTNVEDVVEFALKCSKKYENIFIGGNGQQKIIEITNSLKEAISAK